MLLLVIEYYRLLSIFIDFLIDNNRKIIFTGTLISDINRYHAWISAHNKKFSLNVLAFAEFSLLNSFIIFADYCSTV